MKKKVRLPYLTKPTTIHIQHVVPSFYDGEELVIFRRYIKHRWIEEMMYKHELERYEI